MDVERGTRVGSGAHSLYEFMIDLQWHLQEELQRVSFFVTLYITNNVYYIERNT